MHKGRKGNNEKKGKKEMEEEGGAADDDIPKWTIPVDSPRSFIAHIYIRCFFPLSFLACFCSNNSAVLISSTYLLLLYLQFF